MNWSRLLAILVKEFRQIRRDRLTFAMMVMVPIMQLILFGFAINTDPKQLPMAAVVADNSEFARTLTAEPAELRILPDHAPAGQRSARPIACSSRARCSSCWWFRWIFRAACCAASIRRSCSRSTPPIPRQPATRSRRSARSAARRCRATWPARWRGLTNRRRRTTSASSAATTRRACRATTSFPA